MEVEKEMKTSNKIFIKKKTQNIDNYENTKDKGKEKEKYKDLEATRNIDRDTQNISASVHTNVGTNVDAYEHSKTDEYFSETEKEKEKRNDESDNNSDASSDYNYKNKFHLKKNSIEIKKDKILKKKIETLDDVNIDVSLKRENSLCPPKKGSYIIPLRKVGENKQRKNTKIKTIDTKTNNEKVLKIEQNKKVEQKLKRITSNAALTLNGKHTNEHILEEKQVVQTSKNKIESNKGTKEKETKGKSLGHKKKQVPIEQTRKKGTKEQEEDEEGEENAENDGDEKEEEEGSDGDSDSDDGDEKEERETETKEYKRGTDVRNVDDKQLKKTQLKKNLILYEKNKINDLSPVELIKGHEKLMKVIEEISNCNQQEIKNLRNEFLTLKSDAQKLMNSVLISQKYIDSLK